MVRCTVLMTSYNGEKYIKEQIESIMLNLSDDDELIISDDGSNDSTISIINEFCVYDKRIKIIKGPSQGLNKNIDYLLKYVNGEFVFFADQDDLWLPGKVDKILDVFDRNPKVNILHHNAFIIDSSGKEINDKTLFDRISFTNKLCKALIKPHFYGSMMAFRFKVIRYYKVPKYNGHDVALGLLGCKTKSMMFIDDCLMKYRRHENNVSSLGKRKKRVILKSRFKLFLYFLKNIVFIRRIK